jgi:peptidoglycan hydrolase-like protein with peptidoglycan-binding domain
VSNEAPPTTSCGGARRVAGPVVALIVTAAVLLGACGGSGSEGDSAEPVTTQPTTSLPATTVPATQPTTTAPTTTTTTTSTTTTTTTAPPRPEDLVEPAGPLQSGSEGRRTKALQESLKAQGYDPGKPDGQYGLKTTMAVWAWQALHGQAKDGVVTPQLEAMILARPAQPMLRPAMGPTHTEVDLTRQVILVWKDGRLALVSHVSTGSQVPYCENGHCGNAVTPVGTYDYNRRVEGWRNGPLGKLYNPVYFVGGIAVHGAPSVPNRPASHGCVRIPMHIAEYFPTLVANGDPVETFRS